MTVAMAGGGPGVHSMLVGQVKSFSFFFNSIFLGFRWVSPSPNPLAGGTLFQPRAFELLEHVHPDPAPERAQRGQVHLRKQWAAQCRLPADGLRRPEDDLRSDQKGG